MQAGVATLNGIWGSMMRQEGIHVSSQEKDRYIASTDADGKRTALIDTMYRIVNIADPSESNLVALEEAINDSTPQGTVRTRDEEEDEDAAEGSTRAAPVPRIDFATRPRARDVPEFSRVLNILRHNIDPVLSPSFPVDAIDRLLNAPEPDRQSDLIAVYDYMRDNPIMRDDLLYPSDLSTFEAFVMRNIVPIESDYDTEEDTEEDTESE